MGRGPGDGPFWCAKDRGRIYLGEPTGPFEDDLNLTNKRFLGNPTRSYRSHHPLRILGLVEDWPVHTQEAIDGMLASQLSPVAGEAREVTKNEPAAPSA